MTIFAVEKISTTALKNTVIAFVGEKNTLLPTTQQLDKTLGLGGSLTHMLQESRFVGAAGDTAFLTGNGRTPHVLLVGVGKHGKLKVNDLRKRGIDAGAKIDALGLKLATLVFDEGVVESKHIPAAAQAFAEGVALSVYRFDELLTEQKPNHKARFEKLTVCVPEKYVSATKNQFMHLPSLMDGVNLTRRLVNLPPNIAVPELMASEAKKLSKLGVKVEVFDEKQIAKMGLNLMHAVGKGAEHPSRFILMHYNGAGAKAPVKAIVGKGVMFDTGGYNLKPGDSMKGMKSDMAGAAAVLGAMHALASRKAKVNVVGVMGCVMNMVDAVAFIPESIIKSYKGLTVEIGNTDAEGRLVLADAVAYTIAKHKPAELIDLATLTGACMVALGGAYAGLFSNNDGIVEKLQASAETTGEHLWRMPIDDCYAAKTNVADLNNDGSRYGGASTGAVFIKSFVGTTPWAHLDIAGMAFGEKVPGQLPLKGATGYGVRLLVDYLTANK